MPDVLNFGWDDESDALLYQRLTHNELAQRLGCSPKSIQRRKRALGIPRTRAKEKCPVTARLKDQSTRGPALANNRAGRGS